MVRLSLLAAIVPLVGRIRVVVLHTVVTVSGVKMTPICLR